MGTILHAVSVMTSQPAGDTHQDTVLVADEDAGIRSLLCASLRREGYAIQEARNGREALEQMAGQKSDVVLLDLMMPEVSGWEVLEKRRSEPALQKIPVIVISAHRGPDLGVVLASEVCAVLPKPFDLDVLHAVVRTCLAHEHGADAQNRVG